MIIAVPHTEECSTRGICDGRADLDAMFPELIHPTIFSEYIHVDGIKCYCTIPFCVLPYRQVYAWERTFSEALLDLIEEPNVSGQDYYLSRLDWLDDNRDKKYSYSLGHSRLFVDSCDALREIIKEPEGLIDYFGGRSTWRVADIEAHFDAVTKIGKIKKWKSTLAAIKTNHKLIARMKKG